MSLVAPRNEFVVRNVVEGGLLGSRGFSALPVWGSPTIGDPKIVGSLYFRTFNIRYPLFLESPVWRDRSFGALLFFFPDGQERRGILQHPSMASWNSPTAHSQKPLNPKPLNP